MNNYNCIVVLGPTASGKTHLACVLADALDGEIISADSRQVYKQLDIGTGKDLDEYTVNGKSIPYHLLNIRDPNQQFYLHEFINECETAFKAILAKNKLPVICGGTGLYLDSLRKDFSYTQIKENPVLRNQLEELPKEELVELLREFPKTITKHVDLDSKKRLIRAIEIATFFNENTGKVIPQSKSYLPYYIGITSDIETRKKLISTRLKKRIDDGLINECESLLQTGISHERFQFLGLEYKFVSQYIQNKITKTELIDQLQTAIFQFAKRQMTWFRKMEKEGVKINWVRREDDSNELMQQLRIIFKSQPY